MKNFKRLICLLVISAMCFISTASPIRTQAAPADAILGQICLMATNFAPMGWAECNGATLQISQNQALYSLIGTTFGGNGTSNFKLPNLSGPIPGTRYYIAMQGIYPSTNFSGMDNYISQIAIFPFSISSSNCVKAEGQSINIMQNQALYSILGTTFGGTSTTFKLPDLRTMAIAPNVYYYIFTSGLYPTDGIYADNSAELIGSINLCVKKTNLATDSNGTNSICNGGLLNVSSYSVLYSVIGTQFGGNGTTTFGKPDFGLLSNTLGYYLQLNGVFPQRQ